MFMLMPVTIPASSFMILDKVAIRLQHVHGIDNWFSIRDNQFVFGLGELDVSLEVIEVLKTHF